VILEFRRQTGGILPISEMSRTRHTVCVLCTVRSPRFGVHRTSNSMISANFVTIYVNNSRLCCRASLTQVSSRHVDINYVRFHLWSCVVCVCVDNLLSRHSRQRERLHASVRLSVCLSPKYKTAIFSKTKQFRAMVSIDHL